MAQTKKPNILVIWGDDIGITNLSCYSDGLMGYRTPNIDRIANEGMRFTDSYGQQSCTAGRAAFITGQSPYRTGLTKVGMPGADIGLSGRRSPPSPSCSSRWATPPASSARTTSATRTSTCPPSTASTSSSATSITSMPRKSRRTWTTRRKRTSRTSRRYSARGASCTPGRPTRTIPPSIRAGAASASRGSRTPAR